MSSSSSYPTSSKVPPMTWDYGNALHSSNASDLRDLWFEASRAPASKCTLMPIEVDAIKEVLEMSQPQKAAAIDKVMDKDLQIFLKVRTQLHSLMIFWERVIHAKNRLDAEGAKFRGEDGMDMQSCLIGLKIIPRRCTIGLPTLPGARSSSSRSVKKRKATPMPEDSDSETMDNEPPRTVKSKKPRRKSKKNEDGDDDTSDEDEEYNDDDYDENGSETDEESQRGRKRKRTAEPSRSRNALRDQPKGKGRGGKSAHGPKTRTEDADSQDEQPKGKLAKLLRK